MTAEMETASQYFDSLCRTCINEVQLSSHCDSTNQQQWLSIFDRIPECEDLLISELIYNTVPQIEMQPNDERPSKICCKCLEQLLNVYRFQQMCIQSEEQLRALVASKKRAAFGLTLSDTAMQGEIRINDADSYTLNSSTLQNIQLAEQKPLLKTTEATIKPEPVDQNTTGTFSEFIKNEPIEDDEANMEYSDGDTMHSTISMKNEVLSIESDEQQTSETPTQHLCHLCNKSFKTLGYLKKHLKRHKTNDEEDDTSKRPYACSECGKSYKEKWNLTRHIRTHSDDKPYECPYCPLSFQTNTNIARHISTHEGVRREDCDICGKSIRASEMKKHKLIHSTEKPHKCDFCGKCFADPTVLRRHMLKHSVEKPFKCKYCERAYASHGMLMSHLRIHLGDKVNRCELCPLAFRLAADLRLHFLTHKNEDAETRQRNMQALKEEEAKLELKLTKKKSPEKSTELGAAPAGR